MKGFHDALEVAPCEFFGFSVIEEILGMERREDFITLESEPDTMSILDFASWFSRERLVSEVP